MRLKGYLAAMVMAGVAATAVGAPAGAAPTKNRSPNQEDAFPVVCDGVGYTLIDAPANPDHAEFTAAFMTDSGKVVIPFAFDATQTVTVLTDGAVFDGVSYDAGDVLFSGSESKSIGARRPNGQTCTFGGEGVETFEDDNGLAVEVRFEFSGVAQALLPNSR